MTEPVEKTETDTNRKPKTLPGIGLPAGSDYPNLSEISSEPCKEVFWRKEVASAFETANNGYSFYRIKEHSAVFAKDLSGYWYKLNNSSRCFEFLFEGFKDTTDYTRMDIPPQAPTFVGFNYLHQAVFPMNDDGKPILPKDDKGKTIFPFYEDYPLFPVDDSGAICVPLGDDGNPVFPRIPEEFGAYVPCDITGRVVLPLDGKGEPVYPRDEAGNVLMPFIILEDGSRKRAVYLAEDGCPILPFHNGEQALIVHDGEVLFQYEYQQKMMMMAQYPAEKQNNQQAVYMDEQFYQQHAEYYQSQQQQLHGTSPMISAVSNSSTPKIPEKPKSNVLLQQLSFLKKKKEVEATPTSSGTPPPIPAERPAKPNKEKERAGRYIPEPAFRNSFRSRRDEDNRHRVRDDDRRRRSRSRSLTWSPEDRKRSRSRSNERRHRKRKEEKKRRKRESSSSSSSGTDYEDDRKKRRSHKKESRR